MSEQRIVFAGAGSAGCGIAEQIIQYMQVEGLSLEESKSRIFLLSKEGVLHQSMPGLLSFQRALAAPDQCFQDWKLDPVQMNLEQLVKSVGATVLIGVSGQPGLFTKEVVEGLLVSTQRPIVLPLSNPTSRVEAQPADIVRWTAGQALIATGSPFDPVDMGSRVIEIAQCNNSYIFPGLGLGVIVSGAHRVTDKMMMAASRALADLAPTATDTEGCLLPKLADIRHVSQQIALAVFHQAVVDGVAMPIPDELIQIKIQQAFWEPEYREYRRTSF